MKTAISIPDSTFKAAEQLAQRLGISRSELYTKAISTYVKEHRSNKITEILNEIYSKEVPLLENVIQSLQLSSLSKDKW